MATIDRDLLKNLRNEINAALVDVATKHGITVNCGNATYNTNQATFKLDIRAVAEDGKVYDPKASAFIKFATAYGMEPEDLNTTFTTNGDTFEVVGLDTKRSKYPIIVKNVKTNKMYCYTAETVNRAMNRTNGRKPVLGIAPEIPPVSDGIVAPPPSPVSKAPLNGNDKRIIPLTDSNPYKPGSKAAITFDLMVQVGTVSAFKAACAAAPGKYDGSYLSWAQQRHGNQPAYIRVE